MQETCQIGGRILASLSMSIIHLSSGTVNDRTQLRLKFLYHSLFLLVLPHRLLET